ncbi:MAG: hypothetical protein V3V99_09420 [candidate division Zixibacteria bacterium]
MPENNIETICQSLLNTLKQLTNTTDRQLRDGDKSTPRIEKIDFDKLHDELGFVASHLKDYSRNKNDNDLSRKWLIDRICAFRRARSFLHSQSSQGDFDELNDCTMATLIREYENQASQLRRNISNNSRLSISRARHGAEFAQYKS